MLEALQGGGAYLSSSQDMRLMQKGQRGSARHTRVGAHTACIVVVEKWIEGCM